MKVFKKACRIYQFIIILILLCIVIFSYNVGYFPIAGNMIAQRKLTEYSNSVMKNNQEFEIRYDWYNNKYVAIREDALTLSYNLKLNTIFDEATSAQIDLKAREHFEAIKGMLPSTYDFPSAIYVYTTINSDDYSVKSQRFYLGVYNSQYLSEEESQEKPALIAQQLIDLMGDEYSFTGIQLIYLDRNGGYTIVIPSDKFEPLKYDDLVKNTRKMSKNELGEAYYIWLEQVKDL